jgi:thiol:disulfide interchange protein DsbD
MNGQPGGPAPGGGQANHVTPAIVTEYDAWKPGARAWLGLEFMIQPGWHIYWNGVNDTGLPPKFEIKAPEGFKIGDALWPAPRRNLAPGNILDFIYESRVMLLIPVDVPKDVKPGTVTVSADCKWLVCSEVCLPESGKCSAAVAIAKGGETPKLGPSAPRFEESRRRIPKPLPPDSTTKAQIKGGLLVVESPQAAKLSFFPGDGCVPMPKLAKQGQANGERLSITLEPDSKDPKAHVKGVIEVAGKDVKQPEYFSVDLVPPVQ